jgi:hypothetical protein
VSEVQVGRAVPRTYEYYEDLAFSQLRVYAWDIKWSLTSNSSTNHLMNPVEVSHIRDVVYLNGNVIHDSNVRTILTGEEHIA